MTLALELVGVFAFAVCRALLAIRTKFDVIGIVLLAAITALGGGLAPGRDDRRHPAGLAALLGE